MYFPWSHNHQFFTNKRARFREMKYSTVSSKSNLVCRCWFISQRWKSKVISLCPSSGFRGGHALWQLHCHGFHGGTLERPTYTSSSLYQSSKRWVEPVSLSSCQPISPSPYFSPCWLLHYSKHGAVLRNMVEMQSQLQTVLLLSQIYLLQHFPAWRSEKDPRRHCSILNSAASFSFPFPRIYSDFRGISHVAEDASKLFCIKNFVLVLHMSNNLDFSKNRSDNILVTPWNTHKVDTWALFPIWESEVQFSNLTLVSDRMDPRLKSRHWSSFCSRWEECPNHTSPPVFPMSVFLGAWFISRV